MLWVDDNPTNNQAILQTVEQNEVNLIVRETTTDALKFLEENPSLLSLGQNFRIVSDMNRKEGSVVVPDAGAILLEQLVQKYPLSKGAAWKDMFKFYVASAQFTKDIIGMFDLAALQISVVDDMEEIKQFVSFL